MPGTTAQDKGLMAKIQYSSHSSMIFRFIAIFLLASSLGACAVNPVTGKNEIAFYSEAAEINIGTENYLSSQQSQGGSYTVDAELTQYVNQVGQRIAEHADRKLPYEFVVLNNSVPNAWALPGGKIALNRGLLVELNSEAELAAVLSHEIVHAAARHGAKNMERGAMVQGGFILGAILVSDSDYADKIVGPAQIGAQLISSKYGRDAEREADYYGMQYMVRAGYDPAAAVSLQETFLRLSEGRQSNWLDGLFASHPPSAERVQLNRETAASLMVDGEVGEDRYQQALSHLNRNKDAYQAFDNAYREIAKGDLEQAITLVNQAIVKEPAEARFFGLKGDIFLEQKRYRAARTAYQDALTRDAGYYEYYLGRGLTQLQLGNKAEARADLTKSNQLLPTAIASNELGKLALAGGNRADAKNYFQLAASAQGEVGQQASAAFIRLDLPDNPSRYLTAEAALTPDRILYARVSNRSPLAVRKLQVVFEARVNGQDLRRAQPVRNLVGATAMDLSSGWQFKETDSIEGYRAYVTEVRL